MKKTKSKKIAVIGAGIAGLICAYELQKAGFTVTVYEKEKIVGGRMATRTKTDLPFDIGANHLANVYKVMKEYCNALNVSWHKMNFLKYGMFRSGKIIPLIEGVSWFSKIRLSLQFMQLRNDLDFFDLTDAGKYDTSNAYAFMKKKTGTEIADYFVDPFASAYQFHSAKEISTAALVGVMQSIKYHKPEWALCQTKGGMSALPNALAKQLNVNCNDPVQEICAEKKGIKIINSKKKTQSFDAAVIATTAGVAKKILQNPTPEQRKLLDTIKYASTIGIAFRVPKEKMEQFSVVWAPYVESKAICSFTNEVMKGEECVHQNKSLLCLWLHEDFAKKIMSKSDKEIFSIVKDEFLNVCSWFTKNELENYDLQRWPEAMPKFSHGHITKIKEFLENGQGVNGIFFCGDYLNSPWTEGALRCGQRVAKQIIARE